MKAQTTFVVDIDQAISTGFVGQDLPRASRTIGSAALSFPIVSTRHRAGMMNRRWCSGRADGGVRARDEGKVCLNRLGRVRARDEACLRLLYPRFPGRMRGIKHPPPVRARAPVRRDPSVLAGKVADRSPDQD